MANVRTNQILSTSPLPISSGGFPGLRYSRKRVLCYPTVISKHRKHLSAILAWLELQQSLELPSPPSNTEQHGMQSIKALSLYLCECLFVGGRVYLCCEQRAHIRVCRGQWATLDAAPQEPSTLFPEAVSCWPAPQRLAGQLASSRDPVSLLSAGF